jgi:hypothetical protein
MGKIAIMIITRLGGKMIVLNELQIKLAEQMLLSIKNKEMNVTYKELSERVIPNINPRNVGYNIGEVSKLCYELGLPLLSSIVVSSNTGNPGHGFYILYKLYNIDTQGLSEYELYKKERQKIRNCTEWYKLEEHLNLNIGFSKPENDTSAPLEIRILPMSKTLEFENANYEDVQREYFLDKLINQNECKYNFRSSGMNCAPGSLILFQYDNLLIASAELIEVIKYDKPIEGLYKGAYAFNTESIKVFEPISLHEINKIDGNIIGFSQVKQKIDYKLKDKIEELIDKKTMPLSAEEIPLNKIDKYPEGSKKQITVNAHERNPQARQKCIDYYGASCQVCGFDFGKVYGSEFDGKIHIHHIKPISEVVNEYEVDPIDDLIPVCPNCHMALHSKPNGVYSIKEIMYKLNDNKKTSSV